MATEQFANSATSILASTINNSTTSLSVTSASSFPSSGNFRIIVDSEIMKVTAVSGTTFTVARGQEGTTAVTHYSGVAVTLILTQAGIQAFRADKVIRDTVANRPSAGYAGRLYLPTDDNGTLAYDDGSNWKTFSTYAFNLTAPTASTFSTTVGTASSVTFSQNGDSVYFYKPGSTSASGNDTVAKLKSVTPAVTLTAQLTYQNYPPSTTTAIGITGLVIRDSSTGNTEGIGWIQANVGSPTAAFTNGFGVWKLTSSTDFTFSALLGGVTANNQITANSYFPEVPRWVRIIQPTVGNRKFQFSIDSQNWITMVSEAFNSFAASVNQAGFLLYTKNISGVTIGNQTNGQETAIIIRSYKET